MEAKTKTKMIIGGAIFLATVSIGVTILVLRKKSKNKEAKIKFSNYINEFDYESADNEVPADILKEMQEMDDNG